jgi:calpain-15
MKKGIRLVKLRNPWGSFEWKGDWGDDSPLWKKHPSVKLEMGQFDFFGHKVDSDDGCFYMCWDDFLKHFDGIDVCYIQRDMGSLKLDIIEEAHVCGALVGCVLGCLKYWVCCMGFRYLWCSTSSTKDARKSKENFSTKA